jgi:glycosyltransferase involved in cell wall biosynthesis
MRIALLFEYPTLNGGERSMIQVIESIGREPFVALAPAEGRLADALAAMNVDHIPLDFGDGSGNRLTRDAQCGQLIDRIEQVSPDLLHGNSLSMGRVTGAVADRLSIPCTAHLRDIIKLSPSVVADLNRNQRLVAVSDATREFHIGQGLAAGQTDVVFNGVDSERFRPRPATRALHRELGLADSSFVFLTIGQIGLRKGHDVLAAAAPTIAARVPDAQFVIVGERNSTKAESVAFEQKLAADFRLVGLEDRLHRVGYRNDVDQLLNDADLLVHPAKQEPLGRVLLEAAAAGLPIVATAVGGTREILVDGVSARLVPPNDAMALAQAAIEVALDKVKRRGFADAARARVVCLFEAQHAATELVKFWNNVL